MPPVKSGSKTKNKPADSTRQELFRIVGVDLVALTGLSASLTQTILAEVLGLAPHNDISGGKVLRSRTLKTGNRAGQAFRQAAASVTHSNSALGAFYRRKAVQLGPAQAFVATVHKIARAVYFMLKYKVPFEDIGAEGYETQQQKRELTSLQRKAAKLGFTLIPKRWRLRQLPLKRQFLRNELLGSGYGLHNQCRLYNRHRHTFLHRLPRRFFLTLFGSSL